MSTVTGNLDLEPEKADSWNVGVVVSPRFIPGLTASVDYFDIDLKDAIDSLSPEDIVLRCFEGLAEFCAAIVPDQVNSRVLISRQPFNLNNIVVRGIAFEAAYRVPLDRMFGDADGNFTLRGVATRYIDNIVDTGVAGVVPVDGVGVFGPGASNPVPKWIYRFSATYDTDVYSLTAVAHGVSSGKYDATAIECQTNCPPFTAQTPTYEDNSIRGATYVDLNAAVKFDALERGDGEFFIHVTNVFDRRPILLPETGLAASSTYSDLLGRAYRVGVRLKLD